MTTPTSPEKLSGREAREERTLKLVRRIGYVVLFGASLGVFVPLIIGVGVGISKDRIWDPFTGHAVSHAESSMDCLDEAQRMIRDTASGSLAGAGGQSAKSRSWDQRFSLWVSRCRSDHGDVYDMLRSLRAESRKKPVEK